jgi:hypothetical protein
MDYWARAALLHGRLKLIILLLKSEV